MRLQKFDLYFLHLLTCDEVVAPLDAALGQPRDAGVAFLTSLQESRSATLLFVVSLNGRALSVRGRFSQRSIPLAPQHLLLRAGHRHFVIHRVGKPITEILKRTAALLTQFL